LYFLNADWIKTVIRVYSCSEGPPSNLAINRLGIFLSSYKRRTNSRSSSRNLRDC